MSRTKRRDPYYLNKGKSFKDGHITLASTPGWWVRLYMNRPKRRLNRRLCHLVGKGIPSELLPWPTGNHKPHHYFW